FTQHRAVGVQPQAAVDQAHTLLQQPGQPGTNLGSGSRGTLAEDLGHQQLRLRGLLRQQLRHQGTVSQMILTKRPEENLLVTQNKGLTTVQALPLTALKTGVNDAHPHATPSVAGLRSVSCPSSSWKCRSAPSAAPGR